MLTTYTPVIGFSLLFVFFLFWVLRYDRLERTLDSLSDRLTSLEESKADISYVREQLDGLETRFLSQENNNLQSLIFAIETLTPTTTVRLPLVSTIHTRLGQIKGTFLLTHHSLSDPVILRWYPQAGNRGIICIQNTSPKADPTPIINALINTKASIQPIGYLPRTLGKELILPL